MLTEMLGRYIFKRQLDTSKNNEIWIWRSRKILQQQLVYVFLKKP